ncbi:MAG TPA: putative selenate reductase subunit YgfK [Anaerolineae bacterium]|nr:putative selenate reductase subunit YgfK [Anaerolineae bacterium]
MSEEMKVQPFDALLRWIVRELETNDSIFGIPRPLFYTPRPGAPFATEMFGQHLATPIGPAAGPHTQLAQNIVAAWLCGGRFIELKTVQIMDELEIPRPCIDAADEGYNVEWSQELKLEQSAHEYVKAWVLIHLLPRLLGWDEAAPGTIFNMSVGYNLEGIQSPPMQRFMDRLKDASEEIAQLVALLPDSLLPDSPIPSRLTDNVTLSTMHGCPPDEIEAIARYMIEERGLHTYVKLNPTLLGRDAVMRILHDRLGFYEIDIPDRVFAHDLQYDRAVAMIRSLQVAAAERGLTFGVKLSNTLAMANHRAMLPGEEMYMSGRALYPVTMNLFSKLMREFGANLNVSYSAGADALNVTTVLSCGARPVTAATDLLKPGGYARLAHWLERIEAVMARRGAASLEELAENPLENVERAAAEALLSPRYKKVYHPHGRPKVDTPLDPFDCIVAPCVQQCAVLQDVPAYARFIAQGDTDRALAAILDRNPLPGITGYVCTHLCQTRCTQNDYEGPVMIRALKRFATEHGKLVDWEIGKLGDQSTNLPTYQPANHVAIIGSGPAGLSAAYYLALNGVKVTLFEAREVAGGVPAIAPAFRLPREVVQEDVDRIVGLGVELKLGHPVTETPEALIQQGFDAVYIGAGFQRDATLDVEGIEGEGVHTALRFLEAVALGTPPLLGANVLVIGGGNTAMDAARTAQRLTGRPATVVYRRSKAEMPADPDELRDLFDEGNELIELAAPVRVVLEEGRVVALECVRNELGAPGPDGRRRPMPVPGSEFQIPADAIILAIGQQPALTFLEGSAVVTDAAGRVITHHASRITNHERIYAGGDATHGPAIIVQAAADGRAAAQAICARFGVPFRTPADFAGWPVSGPSLRAPELTADEILEVKARRARRQPAHEPLLRPVDGRGSFELVEQTLTEEQARQEALRCVQCASVCDKCVEVCPNRANYTYLVEPVWWTVPVLGVRDGTLAAIGEEPFVVTQGRQIVHVEDLCNECGNCATFCVHEGRPYADKPRLFLDEADFMAEEDNAFYLAGETLRRREGGQEMRLTAQNGCYLYEDGRVQIMVAPGLAVQEMSLHQEFEGRLDLRPAAEMILILEGVRRSLPFLVGA